MATTILPSPNDLAWQWGASLAFAMLFEIKACSLDETSYEDEYRDHRPQKNFVAAYLAKLRELGDPRAELGFASILTDHIASAMHAGEPCLEVCQRCYATPIESELPPVNPREVVHA